MPRYSYQGSHRKGKKVLFLKGPVWGATPAKKHNPALSRAVRKEALKQEPTRWFMPRLASFTPTATLPFNVPTQVFLQPLTNVPFDDTVEAGFRNGTKLSLKNLTMKFRVHSNMTSTVQPEPFSFRLVMFKTLTNSDIDITEVLLNPQNVLNGVNSEIMPVNYRKGLKVISDKRYNIAPDASYSEFGIKSTWCWETHHKINQEVRYERNDVGVTQANWAQPIANGIWMAAFCTSQSVGTNYPIIEVESILSYKDLS